MSSAPQNHEIQHYRRTSLIRLGWVAAGFVLFSFIVVAVEAQEPTASRFLMVIYYSVAVLMLPILPYVIGPIFPGHPKDMARFFKLLFATVAVWFCLVMAGIIAGVNLKFLVGRGL